MAAEDGIKAPPAIQDKLRKLGLTRRDDLVLHLPLRYEDETSITLIGEAMPGVPVQVDAEVLDVSVQFRPRRQLVATVADASGELTLRFLNFYGSQTKQLEKARDDGRRLRIFGENKVQEAKAKIPLCSGSLSWHMVGHLQRNKVREAVQLFEMIHSIDSLKLLEAVDAACDEGCNEGC